jgi:NitT/TauT family transport system substrate-binding protein
MHRKRKRPIMTAFAQLVLVALGAMLFLMACSPSPPAPQVTLRVGLLGIQDDLPYFVMQEQGFAKQHGLHFVEAVYQSGAAIIEALAADAIDVGPDVGTVPVLAAAERGLIPSAVVPVGANYFNDPAHPSIGLLVAPTISSWQALQGQLLAVNGHLSLGAAALRGRLRQEGIQDYTFVEIPFVNMGLAVAGGNVAAAAMSEPWLTQALRRDDGRLLDWVIGGAPFEHIQGTMIIFRSAMHRQNPQAVRAFLRAHMRGARWCTEHPEAARDILAKRLGLSREVAQQIRLPRWSLDARNDPELLERMQPLLVEIGMLKGPIPPRQLYDETLLHDVLAPQR